MDLVANDKLITFINELKDKFVEIQVNDQIKFQKEAHFAIQLLEKNDYLMKVARANASSLRAAVLNIGTIGLTLNPSIGLAYLVPRKNEVCLDISYLGLIKLAQDCGSIKDVKAELVYMNDTFDITGAFTEPIHKYSPFKDRGEIVGAYVVASTAHGTYLTTLMTIEEIYTIRDMSESFKNPKTRGFSPWSKFESEMIKKTVVRRAFKTWPKVDAWAVSAKLDILNKAIEISDNAQGIEFKSEHQIEQEQLEQDFPIPDEEKEIGAPTYRIQNAKYRGMQLKDIPNDELEDYVFTLEKRHQTSDPKGWELEVKQSIMEYLENAQNEPYDPMSFLNE